MEKYKYTHPIVSERFIRLFASVVIVIGLLVLIGWFSGLVALTRSSVNEIPMAPSTAYVSIFMSTGLWFYLLPQKIAINCNTIAIASAVIVICLSCLLIIISILSKSMGKTLESALMNLSKSEAKFRIVFENSPIGKLMTEIDGYLHVNQSFCKIVGYTEEEPRAKIWIKISHPHVIHQATEITKSLLMKLFCKLNSNNFNHH